MLEGLVRNARVLWRAESIIAEIRLRQALSRSGLLAAAGLVGAFGLGMLNVAGFFLLRPSWGEAGAALWVGGADFLLCAILLAVALTRGHGREMAVALDVRQAALDGLEAEARTLQAELGRLRQDTLRVRDVALGIVRNPLDSALAGLAVPVAGMLLKSLRRTDRKAGE